MKEDKTSEYKQLNTMINFDEVKRENTQQQNLQWTQIPDNPYRILIVGGSGSGKINALFNLINDQPDIDRHAAIVLLPIRKKEKLLHFFLKKHIKDI